jgi:hypothetical protein
MTVTAVDAHCSDEEATRNVVRMQVRCSRSRKFCGEMLVSVAV